MWKPCWRHSTRQGFYWWEIDMSYYILWTLSKVGLVRDLHTAPARVLNDKRLDAKDRDSSPDAIPQLPLREPEQA